jgi:hypothetical protein
MPAHFRIAQSATALTLTSLFMLQVSSGCSEDDKSGKGGSGGSVIGAGGSATAAGKPGVGGMASTGGTTGGVTSGGSTATGGTTTAGKGGATSGGAAATTGGAPGGGITGGATASGGTSGGGSATGGTSGGVTSTGGTAGGGASGGSGTPVSCKLPTLPDGDSLPENRKLPDPFTFFDGTKVTTKAQWECRRQEILAMAAKYIYGPVPGTPDEVTGTVSGATVSITAKVGSKSESFSASISGSGSVIAFEPGGNGIFPSSRKKLTFASGFEAKIRNLFGLTELNPNIANGWMLDRVMDVLEKNPDSGHDPTKMMVSGCSGCGKGAFLAGVFSRVPLVIIVESGGGGAANLRQAEWFRHGDGKAMWKCADALPQSIDNLEADGICGPWVTRAADWLARDPTKVYKLPFDQHLLLATIAPRHLLHFSNNNGTNSWCHLGGTCEALSGWAAKPVYKALGIPERMAFQMYDAGHCSRPAEATALAGEFFKRVFEGNTTAKTDVLVIQDNGVQQPVSEWKSMWIDWDMETVLQ